MMAFVNITVFCLLVGWFLILRKRDAVQSTSHYDELLGKAGFMTAIVEESTDGIVVQDLNARIVWANSSWCQIFGYDLSEVLGKNPMSFVIPMRNRADAKDIENFKYDLSSDFLSETEVVRNVRKDGSELWTALSFTHHQLESGEDRVVVICRDVSQNVEREETLKRTNEVIAFRADHDPLTAVANREKFARVFEETRQNAIENKRAFGLLHIDLDHFKSVNDSFGHAAGDAVIMKTADRMRALIGPDELLARIGGDEFVIICPNRCRFGELEDLGSKLIESVSQPVHWEERILRIGASVGVAVSTEDVNDHISMLQKADVALYEAKKQGRGQVASYDHEMDRSQLDKTRLAAELSEALEKDQLDVYLQPQYSMIARAVTGFEALVRWHHPTKGLLLPRDFLHIATETGVIHDIDRYVATRAFAALRDLDLAGHTGLHISINMSPTSMVQNGYAEFLKWEAEKYSLNFERICIEVLETAFLSTGDDLAARTIKSLSAAGFRVELDDFGTGYAGLAHLGRLRVDGVKIDKSMINGLAENVTNQIIVQAMVGLCSDLGLQIIAEGVVNMQDARLLRQFGCINVQGKGVSAPLPVQQVTNWLETTDLARIFAEASAPIRSYKAVTW